MFLFCRHSIVDLCEVKDWKSLYALLRELYSEFSDNVMGSGSIGAGTYFYYQQVQKRVQEEHYQILESHQASNDIIVLFFSQKV